MMIIATISVGTFFSSECRPFFLSSASAHIVDKRAKDVLRKVLGVQQFVS